MLVAIKAGLSLAIIFAATAIARRFPALGGLVAVMPLTGALVLVWVYVENEGRPEVMLPFARGALLGLVPSVLFFCVAFVCLKKQLPLTIVLGASFGAWLAAALLHQWALK